MTIGLGTSIINATGSNGLAYMVSNGLVSCTVSGTGNFPLSIFNPSSAKNILIYSIMVGAGASSLAAMLAATTTDPAYASALTPTCAKIGGAASLASVTWVATSQSAPSNAAIFAELLAGG